MNIFWKFSHCGISATFPLLAGMALLSQLAFAEGAVRELACVYERVCDASGTCADEAGEVTFRMQPVELADDGSGTFVIRYNDGEFAMQALSFAGPFHWSAPGEKDTLLANSETQFLWHKLVLGSRNAADSHFMRCRFTQ